METAFTMLFQFPPLENKNLSGWMLAGFLINLKSMNIHQTLEYVQKGTKQTSMQTIIHYLFLYQEPFSYRCIVVIPWLQATEISTDKPKQKKCICKIVKESRQGISGGYEMKS